MTECRQVSSRVITDPRPPVGAWPANEKTVPRQAFEAAEDVVGWGWRGRSGVHELRLQIIAGWNTLARAVVIHCGSLVPPRTAFRSCRPCGRHHILVNSPILRQLFSSRPADFVLSYLPLLSYFASSPPPPVALCLARRPSLRSLLQPRLPWPRSPLTPSFSSQSRSLWHVDCLLWSSSSSSRQAVSRCRTSRPCRNPSGHFELSLFAGAWVRQNASLDDLSGWQSRIPRGDLDPRISRAALGRLPRPSSNASSC